MEVRLEKVAFSYGKSMVLDGISIRLEPGNIVAVCGPNGAGKSTLIKCINRILSFKGTILISEKDINTLKMTQISQQVGYVPQDNAQVFSISVFDMVMMGRRPYIGWRSREKDREKVLEILELLGLSHLGFRDFNQLSGGQQQKVIIARALAQEPDVLLLDEPTSSLDLGHQLEVMELIQSLVAEKNILVVMSVHDLNLAAWYADQIIMLKECKVACSGVPGDIITPENILSIYGVVAQVKIEQEKPYIIPLHKVKTGG
ncbi:ABC transporter ATP-binding protein [Desulfotignum phosphitoxidans]|uniref:ABC transporter ATP-binding protein n=1 Tax=Desulfotignum phosphitoxidans DSM 13687 TaxID=1286635 RepID=S0G356_9BACT|nr:ABC transporter ATP-binding protein [Desulfotignum phosphitoxidans]EMS81315.1 ABC transporter ATP-binding protein [Desulfotignum phosphitoxidans DSM 13687]